MTSLLLSQFPPSSPLPFPISPLLPLSLSLLPTPLICCALKVHLVSPFIMNGVCVKWEGWIDLETLSGKAKLLFDEEQAKVRRQQQQQQQHSLLGAYYTS